MNDKKKGKRKIPVKYLRLYRQFKIFYRNPYGKIGFIIILGFVIITILTPMIVINPSYSSLAPVVDTSSPEIQYTTNVSLQPNLSLNGTQLYFLSPSDTNSVGTDQLIFSSENGDLYSMCINAPNASNNYRMYKIYSPGVSGGTREVEPPILATLEDCSLLARGILVLTNFIFVPTSAGNIIVGEQSHTSYSPVHPKFIFLYNLSYNGTLASPLVTNALPYTYFLYNNPSYDYQGIGAASQGQFFFVNSYLGSMRLHDFSIFPESQIWKHSIPLTGQVGISFVGGGFTVNQYNNHSEVLVYNRTSIYSYYAINGTEAWNIPSGLSINMSTGIQIPPGQDESYTGTNYGFFIESSRSVMEFNVTDGKTKSLFNCNLTLTSLSTTDGAGSFPSGIVLTTNSTFVVLHQTFSGAIISVSSPIPSTAGKVMGEGTYSGSYNMIYITSTGTIFSINTSAVSTSGVYLWSLHLAPVASSYSDPVLVLNGESGDLQIGVISSSYHFYLFSAVAVDKNPISPTLTSITGQSFPLGTEYKGYNVWSLFIGSFWVDWEFGIIIGLYTMGLAVIIAMYVGYKGGVSGNIIETISLGIYLTPSLGLLIALTDFFPANQRFYDIILVIGGLGWPFAAFTLMGIVKTVKNRTYIEASKMLGASTFTILRKDVLPNLGPLMLYMLSLSIAGGAAAVSSLQFLGIARITLPTWGGMLSDVLDNFNYLLSAPFWVYPPVIALSLFVISFIFISRGMDELTNPRLRRR